MGEPVQHKPKKSFLPWWLESASIGLFMVVAMKLVPAAWLDDTLTFTFVAGAAAAVWFVVITMLNRFAGRP